MKRKNQSVLNRQLNQKISSLELIIDKLKKENKLLKNKVRIYEYKTSDLESKVLKINEDIDTINTMNLFSGNKRIIRSKI